MQAFDGGGSATLGPLSRAIEVDGSLSPDLDEQTAQTLQNIGSHLNAAGLSLRDVVSTTIYLTDRSQYQTVNDVYRRYFTEPYPARATVVCDLVHREHLVEMSAVARQGASG